MKYLKKFLKVLIWPIVFAVGQFFIQYIFIYAFNLNEIKKLKMLYPKLSDLKINKLLNKLIQTTDYNNRLTDYINSKTLLIMIIIFIILFPILYKGVKKYKTKPENIVGHSDVAPSRKPDPGKAFFWRELAKEGIGFWFDVKDANKMRGYSVGELLQIIGYDISDIYASAYAFCRRFLPRKVEAKKDVFELVNNVGKADDELLNDEEFLQTLKAVAYRYFSESKTPCKI